MDRQFAAGTVNAAEAGDVPPLFLLHSLLSDRASFDAIVPELSKSFARDRSRNCQGFGRSQAVSGGLAAVADRMAEAVKDAADGKDAIVLGNGYGGFVALQMAIRHPGIAARLVLADCGAAFSEAGPPGLPQHGGGIQARDVGDHRCRDAPAVRAGIPGAASRPDAGSSRGIFENRPGGVSGGLRRARRTRPAAAA